MSGWRDAVRRLTEVGWYAQADWMITGPVAEALHGVDVEPTEIEVLVARLSDLVEFAVRLTEPGVFPWPLEGDEQHTRGVWQVSGTPVSVTHRTAAGTDLLLPDHGRRLWESRQFVSMDDLNVPVVPLEVLAVAGLAVNDVPAFERLKERGWDRPLLAEALRGQGFTARSLAVKYPDFAKLMA